ncbi:DNA-binding response regulator [Sphingobacterium endophyticum]|uniref:DNA-binding response regulator n=1 Tax=Sphingobacterium endophyticum TaxID=2546448 RepID=UPI0012E1AF88|nr:DNA-binding response regulator [Sphingobacterium endophyticum]
MNTVNSLQEISIAFINDKSPILDLICNDLKTSGFEITFQSETIEDGLFQLATLKKLPKVCIIDLDFYDKNILSQLYKLKTECPTVKLLSHSDIDNEKVGKAPLDIGFSSCLLVGSDVDDFRRAIDKTVNCS